MKKLFCGVAFALWTGVASASPFTVLSEGHWAYSSINYLSQSGVLEGYKGNLFSPGETATRYDLSMIVSRLRSNASALKLSMTQRESIEKLARFFQAELALQNTRSKPGMQEQSSMAQKPSQKAWYEKISMGGHARVRQESRSADQAPGTGIKDSASRTLGRLMLDTSYSGERADVFTQVQYQYTMGDRGGTATSLGGLGGGDLSFSQAWVDLKIQDDLGLKMGRQGISTGNQSLIGRLNWDNNPRSFDGFRLHGTFDEGNYSLAHVKLSNAASTAVPGLGLAAVGVAGLNDTELQAFDVEWKEVFDGKLHAHWYHTSGLAHGRTAVNNLGNSLHTYGFDWTRKHGDWDFYVQYAWQSGDNGVTGANVSYDGDMLNLKAMYALDDDDTIGVEYAAYSGDDATSTGNYEGFIGLFPTLHKFLGHADVFAQTNVEDLVFHWIKKLSPRNTLKLSYHMFDLENQNTAVSLFGAGGPGSFTGVWNAPAPTANAAGVFDKDLGDEIDLFFSHKLNKKTSIGLGYAVFSAGSYFTANKAAGAYDPDVEFAWISTDVKF